MKKRIEVRSQAEFDACVKLGNIAVVINCRVVAWGNSSVVAWGNSSVEAWGNSSVVARENSSVVARENSSVVAWGNSSVEAWGNVFVRLFSALRVKASAYVTITIHGHAQTLEGGNQIKAAPEPTTGAEYCEFNGIDPSTADFVVPNIDAAILDAIKSGGELNMSDWHTCDTTHCRAGWAVVLAGEAGRKLEKKYGPETAGRMIYAVSRPNKELPDFFASNLVAMKDIEACAADEAASS